MKLDLYDFDGTIYDGDSGVDLILFAISKKPKIIFNLLGSLGIVILYLLKIRTKEEMKNRVFSFLKEFPDTDSFVSEFWVKNEHKLKDFWINKKSHKNDIIISASGYFWLKPIADKYKVKDLFATDINPKTGKVKGKNCHSSEKVKLFKKKYPDAIINKMYTDSINDLPLIEVAKEGFLVKKNKIYNYYEYKPNIIVRFWRWGWGIYHKNEEVWNYLIVGGLTTFVSIAVKWGLYFTILDVNDKLDAQIGVCVSWVCAVIFAYVANRIFVFKSKNKDILKEISQFVGARLLTLGMEMVLTFIFFNLLGLTSKIWIVLVTFIIQVLVMVLNYVFSKLFVFKKGK